MSTTKRPAHLQLLDFQRKTKKQGHPVSAMTRAASKRIGGSQRAEQARTQKRRDAKR